MLALPHTRLWANEEWNLDFLFENGSNDTRLSGLSSHNERAYKCPAQSKGSFNRNCPCRALSLQNSHPLTEECNGTKRELTSSDSSTGFHHWTYDFWWFWKNMYFNLLDRSQSRGRAIMKAVGVGHNPRDVANSSYIRSCQLQLVLLIPVVESWANQPQVKMDTQGFSLGISQQSFWSICFLGQVYFFFLPELLVGNSFLLGARAGVCRNFLKY